MGSRVKIKVKSRGPKIRGGRVELVWNGVEIMRALVIIPAYNEELTIGSVVALARKYGDASGISTGGAW